MYYPGSVAKESFTRENRLNIKKEISPDNEVTIEIEVSIEETGDVFIETLKKFRRDAKIPGFRPGRVPMGLIRQRWGKALLGEKAEEIARDHLVKAMEKEELESSGRIEIEMVDYGESKPLLFKAKFLLQPDAKLTHYKELRVVVNDAEVTDSDVEKEFENLRHEHAFLRSIDESAPGDARLTLKVQEVDPSGLTLVGRPVEEKTVEMGYDELGISSDEQLLGVKAGEKRLIEVIPDPGKLSQAPAQSTIITPGQADNRNEIKSTRYLSVEVEKVEIPELPDLDDLAGLVDENFESLDDLRKYVRVRMLGFIEMSKLRQMERELIDRLIEDNPFPVSGAVVDATLHDITDSLKLEGEKREQFCRERREDAEIDLRWVLLRDKIAKLENIKITSEDLAEEISRIAERSGKTIDEVRNRLKSENGLDRLRQRLYEQRVIDFLKTNADIDKRMMTFHEFVESVRT